jgi:HEAT repeat protein
VEISRLIELKSSPLPASPARLSDHIVEELDTMEPQQQAEMLVQRAANQYAGAIELIAARVESWRGHINLTPQFTGVLSVALNSNDLRVRAAALEVYLAAYDLEKSSASFYQLAERIEDDAASRPWALWMLGALGNRGVERAAAFEVLRRYLRGYGEETRYWAVSGLGLLGSDDAVPVLLDTFRDDSSARVREHVACNLAQSGMFTPPQRMSAVPALLGLMDDPSLDPATQGWAYQALRDITGQSHGRNPAAWRNWWDARSRSASLKPVVEFARN